MYSVNLFRLVVDCRFDLQYQHDKKKKKKKKRLLTRNWTLNLNLSQVIHTPPIPFSNTYHPTLITQTLQVRFSIQHIQILLIKEYYVLEGTLYSKLFTRPQPLGGSRRQVAFVYQLCATMVALSVLPPSIP